jgi:hypothetical protein
LYHTNHSLDSKYAAPFRHVAFVFSFTVHCLAYWIHTSVTITHLSQTASARYHLPIINKYVSSLLESMQKERREEG